MVSVFRAKSVSSSLSDGDRWWKRVAETSIPSQLIRSRAIIFLRNSSALVPYHTLVYSYCWPYYSTLKPPLDEEVWSLFRAARSAHDAGRCMHVYRAVIMSARFNLFKLNQLTVHHRPVSMIFFLRWPTYHSLHSLLPLSSLFCTPLAARESGERLSFKAGPAGAMATKCM